MKTVYSYHPDTGAYTGPITLDESDLSPLEQGVYLIPGGCLQTPPPAAPAGYAAVVAGGQWTIAPLPEAPAPPAPPPAAPTTPSVVSMRQARLALLDAGLLSSVEQAIAALDGQEKQRAQIEWDYASTVDRASPFMQTLAGAIGLDVGALDALFTAAAAL
ncbi:hypothetical protein [Variovorax paradoxus]|jgi:hypothetical protein|uniref:hypothetical protein n=1 Tax=Variovorax paradoxus TaxID=34073 RepID=UPI0006E52203|nr:hypothetical protein APR52_32735 [Variovorax paradoxus]KPV20784.1 hypothetical protein APR51_15800 [Variovorax paradoxus]